MLEPQKQLAAAKPSQWDAYFPDDEFQPDNHLATLIQQLVTHLSTDAGTQHIAALQPAETGAYTLPFSYQSLKDVVDNLHVAFEHQPAVALQCLKVAFAEVCTQAVYSSTATYDHTGDFWMPQQVAHIKTAHRPASGPAAAATQRL